MNIIEKIIKDFKSLKKKWSQLQRTDTLNLPCRSINTDSYACGDNYNLCQAIRIIFSSMVVWEINLNETESELDLNDWTRQQERRGRKN